MQAVDLAQLGEQLVERGLAVQILAVARGVLRDDVQLAHAVGGKLFCFGEQVLYFSAAEFSANHRNRAEGAFVVAALRDFQICRVKRRGLHSAALQREQQFVGKLLNLLTLQRLGHDIRNLLIGADADRRVNFVELLGDFVLIALGKTAGDNNRLDFALALEVAQLDDFVDALLLGGVDEAAGVHNYRVGVSRIIHDFKAPLTERVQQHFGVYLVFGAAQRHNTDLIIHMQSSLFLLVGGKYAAMPLFMFRIHSVPP